MDRRAIHRQCSRQTSSQTADAERSVTALLDRSTGLAAIESLATLLEPISKAEVPFPDLVVANR